MTASQAASGLFVFDLAYLVLANPSNYALRDGGLTEKNGTTLYKVTIGEKYAGLTTSQTIFPIDCYFDQNTGLLQYAVSSIALVSSPRQFFIKEKRFLNYEKNSSLLIPADIVVKVGDLPIDDFHVTRVDASVPSYNDLLSNWK